ncbi:dihydrolipoyl dehydrogenase [Yoonia sp.]|uniref:dihydrolipoyl dehydrogenase n=1 Tax=Yoonia sp. TaxID=2212373 RepID=UPI003F6C3209
MNTQPLDVAIIGAGTAGLSARAEVAKMTDSYRVFDPGPYGTTCVLSACMPSKALLQSAHDFQRRHDFDSLGIVGAETLRVDAARVLTETRKLRDLLAGEVIDGMSDWRETHLVPDAAVFQNDGTLRAGKRLFRPHATIIATGSRPVVPTAWRDKFGTRVLTSNDIFALKDLPRRMAVIGLGPVGLELGQALGRLGVQVIGFDPSPSLGGLDDPELQARLHKAIAPDMTCIQAQADPVKGEGGAIRMQWKDGEAEVDYMLVAMGRKPNLTDLGLEAIGVDLGDDGLPELEPEQLNLLGTRLYFAGDSGQGPGLLHEASDEGRIAGYFAVRDKDAVFRRRTPLRLVFSDPQIALVGASWTALQDRDDSIAVGEASFDHAGRTRLQRAGGGTIRIYAQKADARLLGAAIVAPEAEHLAHLLAYAIDHGDDLQGLLRMPAYHPTHEEVMRRALRSALKKCDVDAPDLEAIRCKDPPMECHTEES